MHVRSLGQEDPLEEGMAAHSSILAWRIPWTEEPGRLQGCKESDMTEVTQHSLRMPPAELWKSYMILAVPTTLQSQLAFQDVYMSPWWLGWYKESARSVGDSGLIPGLGRSPGEVNGNPLQYSCLENPVNRGAWWAAVHGVAKSQTCLSNFHSFTNIW